MSVIPSSSSEVKAALKSGEVADEVFVDREIPLFLSHKDANHSETKGPCAGQQAFMKWEEWRECKSQSVRKAGNTHFTTLRGAMSKLSEICLV